ncbi:trypsin-3 [Anabrus simplex]|uniref:trypsin-3 n=1 Tax=Anabrus simplex TaxID=316456 RepID=UPI0034DD7BEB
MVFASVKREFKFGGNIQRIQLPEPDDVFEEGSNVSVSGWGFTQAGNWSSLPDVLRVGYVPLVSQETCEKDHGSQGKIDDTMICAGYLATGGVDSCRGDSGGPLEMDGILIGIVSWGRGCGLPNLPGVYTNVAKFREWIRNRTGV